MRPETRALFNDLKTRVVAQYGASAAEVDQGKSFSVGIPQETTLLAVIQQSSEFLQKINMPQVTDITGHKMFAGVGKTVTGRKKDERFMADQGPDGNKYECLPTDSGIAIPWILVDQWARMKNEFLAHYAQYVRRQIALDMMMIGWHGTSAADNTNPVANPKLQDVNKGWLQWMREKLPEQIMAESSPGSGKITLFGEHADYKNLDQLGYDLKQGLGEAHRERSDLIMLVGSDLVAKEADLVSKSHGLTPTERGATKQHQLMGTFGGLPAETPPNFPAQGMVITTYANLSIYIQEGSWRRGIKDNDDKMRIEDKNYRNECYLVEDETLFVGIEHDNVEFEPAAPAP